MFFINGQHKQNYEHLSTMVFRNAKMDSEYHSASYILSVPEIYKRCISDPWLHEFPFLWTRDYKDLSHKSFDDDLEEEIMVIDFEIKKNEKGHEQRSQTFMKLPGGCQHLVELGENLFNKENLFNLTEALSVWDDELFKVYQQAVLIRVKRKIEGVTITLR